MPNNEVVFGRAGLVRQPEGGFGAFAQDSLSGALVSQLLPPNAQLSAAGHLFAIDMSGGTAIAPVVAMPTTSPQWGLYNSSTTETMIVLRASANLSVGTAGLGLSIVGATALGVQTLVTSDYSGTIKSCLNGNGKQPSVLLKDNPTLVGGTPAWFAFEGTKVNTLGTDSVGDTLVAPVDGILTAPPGGHMVAFEVVGEVGAAALYDFQAIIAMVRMD